jgi:GNAT superfamily N-acetyltransferase
MLRSMQETKENTIHATNRQAGRAQGRLAGSISKTALGAAAVRSFYETTMTSASEWLANRFQERGLSLGVKNAKTPHLVAAVSLVPIRSLGANHRERISHHLLSLNPRDRYLRFGYKASDQLINRYVAELDFERDEILGIYDRSLQLIAVAHLAYATGDSVDTGAEFGVSVLPHARGRGYGARLFEHAATNVSNRNITQIYIQALSENTPMIRIATNAGARVERHGCESEAFLRLPAPTLKSRLSEFVEERAAQADYRIKVRTRRTSGFSTNLPEMQASEAVGQV